MPENPIITPITFDPNKQLQSLTGKQSKQLDIESGDTFGLQASDFGTSQYDKPQETSWNELKTGDYNYLRGERQSNWTKAGNGLVGMAGKTLTTAAEGIINPFYGTVAALANGDFNSYYNNDLTQTLDKINAAVDKSNPFYSDKEESTDQGLAKLWHANTIFRDIMGGAGTSIGAALTGAAWSKGLSIAGKALGAAGSTAEAAGIIESVTQQGVTEGLKDVANASTKKLIKDGARQGTIALTSATGEAGAEARETEKNIRYKLTHDDFGNEKQMTEGELAYVDMMAKQAGDMTFGMNLPVIMADNWLTFGKTMFGNKTNDFAKIANKTTVFDEATQAYKAVEKGKYANLGYRAGKIGTPMLSEGNQEMLQFAIGKTAEDYYVKKYYNPNAADFLDSFSKGMADAYGTQEGWHSGIIGALSAGITSPGIVLATQGRKAFKDEFITNPEDKITAQAVESLNKYKAEDLRKKFLDNYVRSANITEAKDDAIAANDDFNYHNANEDMMFSYVYNRLQNGKLDETKQELNNFKNLTIEELKTNYGIEINVENKANIEAITGKSAVQKYVQERLDKIAKVEETYNQITKLFPNAHPDVKELLMYSAQGLDNSKARTKELGEQISNVLFGEDPQSAQQLSTIIPGLLITPYSFAKDFTKMSKEQKKIVTNFIEKSDINPQHKDEIATKLKDLESLKDREVDFTLTYNALKDPKNQAVFLNASENLWGKFADIASKKEAQDIEEESKPVETPVENPPVQNTPTEVINTSNTQVDLLDVHLNTLTDESQVVEALNNTDLSQSEKGDKYEKWANRQNTKATEDLNNKLNTENQQSNNSLEAKKADIERRRQDELNSKNKQLTDYLEATKELSKYGNIVSEAYGKLLDESIKLSKEGKQEESNKLSDLLDYIGRMYSPEDLLEGSKTPISIYLKEAQESLDKWMSSRGEKTISGKINTKYDAELAALNQSNVVEETTILTSEIDPKDIEVIETLSNGASNAFDESNNQDEVLDKSNQISDKEFTSKKPNALMMKHYEFQAGKKVWARDSDGYVIEESNPDVSIAVSDRRNALEGSKVMYRHDGENISIIEVPGGITLGFMALPHETTSTDPVVLASLEELKNIRAYILSKPSDSIRTTVAVKGKGKLLIKIQHNLPVLDQKVSSRSQDMVDNKPLFLYDNGESLVGKKLSTNQEAVANQFAGISYAVENVNDPTTSKLGVGRVFQTVKTANDSWSIIPMFTEIIGKTNNSDKVTNTIIETLINNISGDGMSINYNKTIEDLNKYIFISSGNKFKNHNGIKVFENKDKTEIGRLSISGNTFKFNDIKSNNPAIIVELKKALESCRFNLDLNNLNKTEYQQELLANNVLVTNAYTDSNNNYYVQPYIELNNPEGYITEEVKPEIQSNKRKIYLEHLKEQYKSYMHLFKDSEIENFKSLNINQKNAFDNDFVYSEKDRKLFNNNEYIEFLESRIKNMGAEHPNWILYRRLLFEFVTRELEDKSRFVKEESKIKSVTENNVTETKPVEINRNVDHSFDEGLSFSRTKLEGKPVDKKSIAILEKILPGLTLADAKQIEEVSKNLKDTYGMFRNMLIYLFNGATNQTMYHEAFHGVFRNILSDNERSQVLTEAINKYDKPNAERLQFLREGRGNLNLSEEVLTQLHYEEKLSDDFGKYADGEFNKSLGQTILDFFKKIFDLFNIFKNSSVNQVEKLFSEITKGKFAKRSIDAKLANLPLNYKDFGQAYVRAMGIKDNTPLSYELERTKSISDNILDAISQEVANGTPLTKVDVGIIIQSIKDKYLEVYNSSPEGSVKTMAGRVYLDFDAILENVKKQIWATRKIKLPNVITKDSKIEDSEGVQDTKDTEITSDMEGNETKGWKEMTSISGIKTATHEIKLFLSNIPVIKKDGKIDTDAYGFNKFHSFEEIYHTLENTLIGTTTFEEQTKVLKSLAPYKPVLQQVLTSIEDIKNTEVRSKFKQQFAANFNKQVLNYKLVTYKKVGDNFEFKMIDPNRQGVELNLKTKWESSNIIDPNNLVTNDIRTFNIEEGVYEINPDKVKTLLDSYQGKDLNIDGVFDLANKLGIGLSYSTIETFSNIPSVNKFTSLQNLTRDLLSYANNKWVGKKFSDARKTFNELVKLEVNAQTALFTSSFNNVENSTVYAVQYQSYASKLVNKLSNDVLGYELKQDFERDPIFKNNFLFKNRHNLQMFAMDGLKMEGDNVEGKKFNQIDSDDYTAMIINMFVNKQAETNMISSPALYAPIIPAEKGLSFGFSYDKLTVPDNLEGSTFLEEFRQLFLNEFTRIKQVSKDIRDNKETPERLVNNYHLGKKLGLQFNLTNAIDSKLKAELDNFLESNLDSTEDLRISLSKVGLLQKVDAALIQELENIVKTEKQTLLDKNIIQEVNGKLVSDKISSTLVENTIDKIVREWSLNSYLFNISSSLLVNGDPAFYKGPADNGKRFYQGYSMLKFADTSVIDQSYKFLQGGKMKINVISDVNTATESKEALSELSKLANNPKIQELANAEYNKSDSINATDAQMFVSVDLYNELQKVFGQESDKLSVLKPFYYSNQWNAEMNRYEPVQVKCSVFALTDEYVANNPLLAEHKKLMDESSSYPQVIAFESTMKALSPHRANINTPETTSVVELDLSSFGEQVANPDHMLDSENSSLRQLKMLFYGMVENDIMYGEKLGKDIKAEIALLDKTNIEEALQKVVKGFSTNDPALTKMIQEAITSRNATSIIEKVFQQNADGTFQYPLDLISSSSTIQLISSIFSGNVTRQSFVGGSAVQVSAIGLQVGPRISKEDIAKDPLLNKIRTSLKYIAKDPNNDHSIDYCEAAAPIWMKEFLNEDDTIKDNIPEEMKQLLVYRIPTEGAHSMMAVKVVHFLPNDYKGVMLLPYEVTKQFGADFDFDKIFFIARDSRMVNGEIKPYIFIDDVSKVEERYFIYRELNKDSSLSLEDFKKLSIIEQNVKPARDNKLLDNYMQILRSVNMLESLITPSGPGGIADIAEELERKSTKKKSNNYFTALSQVALKDLFHKISRLKGIAALQSSGHAWCTEGNLNIKSKKTQSGWLEQGVKIFNNGKTVNRNNLNQIKSDNGTKIVEELNAMTATILDAVKTPEMLPSIGITEKTLPLWAYITRLGLGTDVASRITSQPAIKDLSTALEYNDKQLKSKGFTRKSIETVIGDYNKIYTTEFDKVMARAEANSTSQEYYELKDKFLSKSTSKDVMQYDSIDLNELTQFTGLTLDNLSNPKAFESVKLTNSPVGYKTLPEYKKLKFLQLQISLLNMYANNEKIIAELGQLNNLFSINKETGPNFEDVNGKLEIYKTLTSESTLIDGIGELLNSNAIKPYIDTVQAEFNVLENHYNFASNFFNGIKNEIAKKVYGKSDVDFTRLKSEDRNTINGFIQMYLDAETTFKDIYIDENRVSEKEFMDDMAMLTSGNIHKDATFKIFGKQIPTSVQEKLKSMTIFQLLHVENIKNSNERFVSLKGNGKIELHQKELLINDLLTLWNEPSGVYKPLVKRLVEHSFTNTGLFTGLNSYSSYIDPSILQDLGLTENRIKVRPTLKSEFINKDRVDLIVDQLIRNFAKKFTKTYDNDKKLFTLVDDGKTLVVDKDSTDSRKIELNLDLKDTAKVEYIRFKLNKDFTPIYKFDKEASDLSGQVTYRQTTYLGQPGKRLEINPFNEVSTEFPNNKYEKMEIKVKEVKPKNLIPTPKVESEEFTDNSESLYEGYNEIKPTEQDTIEESMDLESTNNNTNLAETKEFNEWYGTELENNPDISLEEALEYYKNCKL